MAGCGGDGESALSPDPERDAALVVAAARGDTGQVRRLLDAGASLHYADGTGRTALIAAAYANHLDVARLLVDAGADVNAKDETVQSAYLVSTSEVGDDTRLLELTLESGADVGSLDSYNGTGLIRAADRGYVEIVRRLLETDIEVDHVNNLGWTALLEAIILGDGGARHTDVVRLLLGAGADPNLADAGGVRPLAHAREAGHEEIARLLVEAGGTP
jgi:ankyrin repeat protein